MTEAASIAAPATKPVAAAPPRGRGKLFRKYVALFVGVVFVALLANGLFEIWFSYQEHKAALVRIQREQAAAAAAKIDQFVKEIQNQLGWTVQLPWSTATTEQHRFDALRLLRQVPAITELAQLDATGHERLRVSRLATDVIDSQADFSQEPKFTEALAHKVWYGPVYFRRQSEPYMTLAVAGARRDAGVSVAEVNLKLIWDVVSQIKVGERGQAYVVDGRGRLIAHPDISLVLRDTDLSQLPQVRAARGDAPQDEMQAVRDIQGRDVLSAHAAIAPLGWLVFAELPLDEAYAPLYASIRRSGALLLAGLMLAFLAGLLLARRMVVPIQALRAGAARIGGGDLGQRISIKTGDELEGLADQFNAMAGQLHASYAGLERKVEERTHDLNEALQQQTAVADVLKVISRSSFDLQPILQTLVATAARLCNTEMAFIMRRDGEIFRAGAAVGYSSEYQEFLEAHPIRVDRGTMTGRVALERRVVQIDDVATDPEYRLTESTTLAGQRTAIGVPLLREGEVMGVIVLARQRVEAFTDKQIALVTTFADQAVIAIENARLLNDLRSRTADVKEALEYQTATSDVLNVISRSTLQLQPVFDTIVRTASRLCDAEFALIFKLQDGNYHLAASNNASMAFIQHAAENPIPPGRGSLIGRTALEHATVHMPDCLADPEYDFFGYQETGKYRSMLGVPLLREGAPVGVIGLLRTKVQPFTDKQIELVTTFADQAVIAIENVRLFDEVQAKTRDLTEALQQQTATADVLKVISRSAFDLDAVFRNLIETAARLCEASICILFRRDGDVFVPAAGYGVTDEFVAFLKDHPMPFGRSTVAGRAASERMTVHIPDIDVDPEYTLRGSPLVGGWRSILGVPLLREGEPLGVLALARPTVGPFAQRQIDLVQTFADQAVIAIENVRLFDEVQAKTRDLTEALQQQTATAEVLKVISRSAFDLDAVFRSLIEAAGRLCDAPICILWRRDGEVFRTAATYGTRDEHIAFLRDHPMPFGRGTIVGRAASERTTIHVPDIDADPEYTLRASPQIGGWRSALCVPLLREGEPLGVLALSRPTIGPFSQRQIELVQTFADQAVIAIENVRLFEEVQARTRDLSEALQQQTATADVLKVISRSAFDLDAVMNTLTRSASELCGADSSVLQLRDGDYLVVRGVSAVDASVIDYVRQNPVRIDDQSYVGRAVLHGSIANIPDFERDTRSRLRNYHEKMGFKALLIVPLMTEGGCVGAFALTRNTVGAFSQRQVELVQTFADQAVIAIENVRLFEEVQARTRDLSEALQQQTATADVLKVISRSAFDLNTVLDTLTQSAATLCNADTGVIKLRQGEVFRTGAMFGGSPAFHEYLKKTETRPGRESVSSRVALSGAVEHVVDIQADPEINKPGLRQVTPNRAAIGVPLLREGKVEGIFVLGRTRPEPFTQRQIELVQTFADQAVIAIENVRLFEEVQARTRELADSLENLRAAQDRLVQSEKMASLGQLTAGIAHEIKNPLNFVNNFAGLSAELLGELKELVAAVATGADAATRADIEETVATLDTNLTKIGEHGRRADGIVRSMLLHSRGGSGQVQKTDLNALIEEALALTYHGLRAQDQSFNITMERDLDAAVGAIDAVPQDLTRVFLNLIGNGFYAANKRKRDGGEAQFAPLLKVTTRSDGETIEVRVRDNGVGIADEVRAKLFTPFFTTKPTGEGTGLGLSISYEIVTRQHGGSIDVESRVGEFTEFIVRLPRTMRRAAETETRGPRV